MGTDIHLFVELDYSNGTEVFHDAANLRAFNEGELFIWRNIPLYCAFGLQREQPTNQKSPLIPPRGLPQILSFAVFYRYYHIVADPNYPDEVFDGGSSIAPSLQEVSVEEAENWVHAGLSHYSSQVTNAVGRPGRPRVSNPAWHTPGWLFLDELDLALSHYGLGDSDLGQEFPIIQQIMVEFETVLGFRHSRLTFWFDS